MTQFLRDQASDNEEVVTPIMLDGTYLSRNLATFGPLTFPAAVCDLSLRFIVAAVCSVSLAAAMKGNLTETLSER